MTRIMASSFIDLRDPFELAAVAIETPPSAIPEDTASAGESVVDDSTRESRSEQVMATYRATLRPLWPRGYR